MPIYTVWEDAMNPNDLRLTIFNPFRAMQRCSVPTNKYGVNHTAQGNTELCPQREPTQRV